MAFKFVADPCIACSSIIFRVGNKLIKLFLLK